MSKDAHAAYIVKGDIVGQIDVPILGCQPLFQGQVLYIVDDIGLDQHGAVQKRLQVGDAGRIPTADRDASLLPVEAVPSPGMRDGIAVAGVAVDGEFRFGILLILLGVIIDGADGIMARHFSRDKRHGVFLDSFADMVTFCFAPAILLYSVYYDLERGSSFESMENALTVAASMLVVLFGMMRLARFIKRGNRSSHFIGLPTPAAAIIIVLSVEVIHDQLAVLAIAILMSFLMISRLRYPMLRGSLGGAVAAVVLVGLLSHLWQNSLSDYILIVVLFLTTIYVVIGPLYIKKKSWGHRYGHGR